MSKIKFLTEKYGITALSNDNLELFISEIYNDGYQDCKNRYKDKSELRDNFAIAAIQWLSTKVGYTGLEYIAIDAYALADEMLKARGKV